MTIKVNVAFLLQKTIDYAFHDVQTTMLKLALVPFIFLLTAQGANAQMISEENLRVMRAACAGDTKRFCSDVKPGEGRIIVCLRQNFSSITPGCREAMANASTRVRPGR